MKKGSDMMIDDASVGQYVIKKHKKSFKQEQASLNAIAIKNDYSRTGCRDM